jgi:hypothetical protein
MLFLKNTDKIDILMQNGTGYVGMKEFNVEIHENVFLRKSHGKGKIPLVVRWKTLVIINLHSTGIWLT